MAEKQLLLEVVTPDRLVLSTEADVVVCPGVEGQFGVLPGHIPFLSALWKSARCIIKPAARPSTWR